MADVLRVICSGAGLLLTFTCVYSIMRCRSTGQMLRFAGLAIIGFVVVAGQIDAWGRPLNWRMPLLTLGLLSALVGTIAYLREIRRQED